MSRPRRVQDFLEIFDANENLSSNTRKYVIQEKYKSHCFTQDLLRRPRTLSTQCFKLVAILYQLKECVEDAE
jgi:hypothetical protein